MAFRNIAVRFTADTAQYEAATRSAAAETKTFGAEAAKTTRSIEADAQANIAAAVKRRESLTALSAEYRKVSQSAAAGSAEQIAADRLAASAAKRLGDVGTEATKAQGGVGLLERGLTQLGATGIGQGTVLGQGIAGLASNMSTASLGVVAGTAAIGVGIAKMTVDGLKDFESVGAEVRKLKGTLGSTAEEASGFRNVAASLGIDNDQLAKGFNKLSINLDKTKGGLAGVHVETARNADGTVNMVKTIDNVRAAYQSIQDPQQRNIFLQQAMSRGGAELRAVMALSNAEFERFKAAGPIFHQSDIDSSRDLSIAQRQLGESWGRLEISLAKGVAPALTTVDNLLRGVLDVSESIHVPIVQIGVASLAAAAGGGVGAVAKVGIGALAVRTVPTVAGIYAATKVGQQGPKVPDDFWTKVQNFEERIPLIGHTLAEWDRHGPFVDHPAIATNTAALDQQRVVLAAFSEGIGLVNDAVAQGASESALDAASKRASADAVSQASVQYDTLHKRLTEATTGYAAMHQAELSYQASLDAVPASLDRVTEAQRKLDDLMRQGPVDLKALASAQDHLTATSEAVAAAQDKVAEAQAHLNDVMKGASAEDLGKGGLSVREATLGIAQANQSVADARARVTDAYKTGDANQIANAELALKQALLGVEAANYRLTDSQKALNDLEQQGKEGSKDRLDAEQQVAAALRAKRDAVKANADAQDAYNTALAGDPDFTLRVAAANRDLAGAHRDVTGTLDAVVQAGQRDIDEMIAHGATMDQVRAAFNRHVEDFRRTATQAGLTTGEVDALIVKYGLIPSTVDTIVAVHGVDESKAKVQELIDEFRLAQGAAQVAVQLFGVDQAKAQIQGLAADVGNILHDAGGPGPAPGSLQSVLTLGRAATGGRFGPGESALVGEEGYPEIISVDSGGVTVTPLGATGFARSMLGATKIQADPFHRMRPQPVNASIGASGGWQSFGRGGGESTIVHEHRNFDLNFSGNTTREQARAVARETAWTLSMSTF